MPNERDGCKNAVYGTKICQDETSRWRLGFVIRQLQTVRSEVGRGSSAGQSYGLLLSPVNIIILECL